MNDRVLVARPGEEDKAPTFTTKGVQPPLLAGSFLDCPFGLNRLLTQPLRNFGQLSLVGTDRGQVLQLANQIQGAKGFPDLFFAGFDGSNRSSWNYSGAGRRRKCTHAAGNRRTQFAVLLAVTVLQFRDESPLMDRWAHPRGIHDPAAGGSGDRDRLH